MKIGLVVERELLENDDAMKYHEERKKVMKGMYFLRSRYERFDF